MAGEAEEYWLLWTQAARDARCTPGDFAALAEILGMGAEERQLAWTVVQAIEAGYHA